MLGLGLIDKDGNELELKHLHQLVIANTVTHFLLKITEETDHLVSFEVYEISSWGEDLYTHKFTVPSGIDLYLTGTIKWDGCSHIYFGEEEDRKQDGYLHLCGKHCWDNHVKLMNELFEFASNRIKCFDYNVAT